MRPFKHPPSTILALVIWGGTGFMAQPTLASLFIHLLVVPLFLFLLVWIAHWEGHKLGKQEYYDAHMYGNDQAGAKDAARMR